MSDRTSDINRIVGALATRGLVCSADTAEMLWEDYSQAAHAVSWEWLPDTQEDICKKLVGDMYGMGRRYGE